MAGLLSDSMVAPQVSFDQLQAGELHSETRVLNIGKPGSDLGLFYDLVVGGGVGKIRNFAFFYGKFFNFQGIWGARKQGHTNTNRQLTLQTAHLKASWDWRDISSLPELGEQREREQC